MKCYLIVLCGVFLNATSRSFDYYSDKYEPIPEDSLLNYKERNDKDPYTGLDYSNSNDLDLDEGSESGEIEEKILLAPSYKMKENDYFIKNCPTSATSQCECTCSPDCPCACTQAPEDYYWRDYKGIISGDALPVGRDIYIGQVYIEGKGIYVGRLTPGIKEIEVSAYGVKKQNYLIKILCTQHKENFCWFNTTSTSFHDDVEDKSLVVGGYDTMYNHGDLHIGLKMEDDYVHLGGVTSFQAQEVYLWYPEGNKDMQALHFQVLIYNKII